MIKHNSHETAQPGTLYVVATPIGNLDDLSGRAASILASADLLLAEDTRHSKKLLSYYGINRAMKPLHQHNEQAATIQAVQQLRLGKSAALLSDAGTPLINDPGFALVSAAHQAGLPVRAIPGPSALTAALSIAAMPSSKFCFEGFLPARKSSRLRCLQELATEGRTMVFFEVPHRIRQFAEDAATAFGTERELAVVKEISKIHETVWRGTVAGLQQWLENDEHTRGEFVLLVSGMEKAESDSSEAQRIVNIIAKKLPTKEAAGLAAEITGCGKNELYSMVKKPEK